MIQEQDGVWEELMKLLDTLAVGVTGPRRLPLRAPESLFDSGAAAIRIGEIPQTRSSSAPPTHRSTRDPYCLCHRGQCRGCSRRPAAAWGCLEKTSAPSSSPPDCSLPDRPGAGSPGKFYAYFAADLRPRSGC